MKRNRSQEGAPDAARAAIDKYVEFHRLDPIEIGAFDASFVIPDRMMRAGAGQWVTYRSGKVDPETLRRPRRPVDYIHEHDAGVHVYVHHAASIRLPDAEVVTVPSEFRNVEALARLGQCLGFCVVDSHGEKHEARGTNPLPELYTVPSGKCLLVIQSRRDVLAMMWGGGLGVFARGIDG